MQLPSSSKKIFYKNKESCYYAHESKEIRKFTDCYDKNKIEGNTFYKEDWKLLHKLNEELYRARNKYSDGEINEAALQTKIDTLI